MGIDLHHVEWAVVLQSPGKGDRDGMVAAETDGKNVFGYQPADKCFDVVKTLLEIRMDLIHVAHIYNLDDVRMQIDFVALRIIGTLVPQGIEAGGIPDAAGPQFGAGAPLRAHVVGHPKDGHIRLQRIEIQVDWILRKGTDAYIGKVENFAFVFR